MKDYKKLSEDILQLVGGKENLTSCMHCMTRLRLNVKDLSLIQLDEIKKLKVITAQFAGDQLQIVIGNEINEVYDAFCEVSGMDKLDAIDENLDTNVKKKTTFKGVISGFFDGIVGSMVPIIPILIVSGLLQAIILVVQKTGLMTADSPTIVTLTFAANAAFYFLPVFIGFFAAKKFGGNPAVGAMLCSVLVHPTFVSMVAEGNAGSIFGLPIHTASYSSTVLPAILSVYFMSAIEKPISKYCPKSIRVVMEPTLTFLIALPVSLCILSPLGAIGSTYFANGLWWLYEKFGFIIVALLSAFVPFVVMTGLHVGTTPIGIQLIATFGKNTLTSPCFFISNFAQGASCLAVALRTKDKDLKSLAYSCAFSCIVPGITEPAMYGITLKYKKPMLAAMIGSFFGGLYLALMGVGSYVAGPPNLFGFAYYIGPDTMNLVNIVIAVAITMVVTFVVCLFFYKNESEVINLK